MLREVGRHPMRKLHLSWESERVPLGPSKSLKRHVSRAMWDRVPSTSLRLRLVSRKVVPGRFGDDDDDDDGEEEDREDDVQKSKRVRIDAVEETERKGEEAKKLKDREVIRQEVDANKASISSSGAPPVSNVRVPWFGNSKHATSGSSLMPVIDSTSACTSKSPIPLFLAPGTTSRMSHSRSNSTSSLGVASRRNNAGSVSSMGMKTFLVGKLRGTTTGTTRARISTLMAPTASSLAKTRRLPVPSDLPFQVKAKGKEKEKEKEKELQKETDAVEQIVNSLTVPRSQSKIFSQPLILMNPLSKRSEPQMSLSAVAATPRRSLQSRRSRR
ncbi:hypothetical protein EV702DRAFT_1100691 [Suillus placidus]|uniref:Uncharacterized protein n=1 Tax=Suillus placidus TaxID=48579 RepID=A0A9P6ZWM1_9AGAM|nr:hypothetical protein EV702DRAFT_1100691 [Suillus placidus]